ncbi:MAG: hypothetical protein Q3971_04260 [Moraxella sp.]|nr:hypothetical protein [Moraxella sp.]
MKKFALPLTVLMVLTACQSAYQTKHPSVQSASSDIAQKLSDDVLDFAVGVTQGDSQRPLNPVFADCVKQPYPNLQNTIQGLIDQSLSQDDIVLLGETFVYLKSDKMPADPTLQTNIQQAKSLMTSPSVQKTMMTLMGMGGDRQVSDDIHAYIHARLSACAQHSQ